jgi:hypothetical protein
MKNISPYQETVNLLAYIQLVGSIDPHANFQEVKNIVVSTYDFLTQNPEDVLKEKFIEVQKNIEKIAALFIERFPPKKDIYEIASDFNDLYKQQIPIYDYGIEYGWLEKYIDLRCLRLYPDLPYQFKIGIGAHKGNGGIEEDNLLKDAFNVLTKAELSLDRLERYGNILKEREEKQSFQFTQESYKLISELKFEVCAYSRLSVIAFYSFVECLVNSVGFNYLYKNASSISENEKEILRGFKKGRYCRLDYKIEKYQIIIRSDKKPVIIATDPEQLKNPFKDFFECYESLRNSSVHFSPEKDRIWLKPHDWIKIAQEFSAIAIDVALQFWIACNPSSDGPIYLGRLDYNLHKQLAKERNHRVSLIDKEI